MTLDLKGLEELAMWSQWQEVVKNSLPNFCADRIYVEQLSPSQEEFEAVAEYVAHNLMDSEGKTRDAAYGGIIRNTKALGEVTRMWLDANIEIDFLTRHMPCWENARVLEIGAGYGRLAVMLEFFVKEYYCIDAVPISTELCKMYCAAHGNQVQVLELSDLAEMDESSAINLAINIHSFNECNLVQIARWLDILWEMRVPWLFTVSHPDSQAYLSYDLKSWKELILNYYDLVAEEFIGLGKCPHALWKRK